MYMQSYHNVTLAYGDSKTEQPDILGFIFRVYIYLGFRV